MFKQLRFFSILLLLGAMSKLSAMSCQSYTTSTQTAEFGYEKAFFFV